MEYLSIPEEERLTVKPPSAIKFEESKIKKGKTGASAIKEAYVPDKSITVPEPVERPVEEVPQEVRVPSVPHPIEMPEAPVKPNLFSFREETAKIEEERVSIGIDGFKEEATISLQAPDIQYESYIHKVGEKIKGVWKYPEEAKKAGLQGRGVISFTLNRQGELIEVKILTSSGYPILDTAIIDAVKKAAKYYPFQENMPVKRVNIVATFEYYLVSPGSIWGH
ncbi:MAG: TonB family protein [Deltaproteobacteria bacterium]